MRLLLYIKLLYVGNYILHTSGADPKRISELSKFQCEKMSATMFGRREKSFDFRWTKTVLKCISAP